MLNRIWQPLGLGLAGDYPKKRFEDHGWSLHDLSNKV